MSNKAWDARRIRQRLDRAIKILAKDPTATVPICRGVVAVAPDRFFALTNRKCTR